jgi:hypothetical protein
MPRALLCRYLLDLGPSLCAVSAAAETLTAARTHPGRDAAWNELWDASRALHLTLARWKRRGLRLADLPPERCLPEHLELWQAADALGGLPPDAPDVHLAGTVAALLTAATRAGKASLAAGLTSTDRAGADAATLGPC